MLHAWRRDHRARIHARGFLPFNVVCLLSAARDIATVYTLRTPMMYMSTRFTPSNRNKYENVSRFHLQFSVRGSGTD